jgi:hypothetical protein
VPLRSGNRFHRICADRADAEQQQAFNRHFSPPLSLITNKGLGGLGQLLMVLLLHHLEMVAQTDSEAQKVVVAAEMEDSETTFPHMD